MNFSFFKPIFYSAFIFSLCSNCYAFSNKISDKAYNWKVKRVIDGDTIEIVENFGLPPQLQIFVRIRNLDTPEKSPKAKCAKEAKLARLAYEFTKNSLDEAVRQNHKITFSEVEWDKYGGRVLAVVKIDNIILAQDLIKNGLGREYHGKKKPNWCT